MDNLELNKYIYNYLTNDKTNSAIMLTADWGTGKSYYVKNELVPYIESNKGSCIVVSLYGLDSVKEISKSIYLEMRAKKLKKKTEAISAGAILAKTVLKGVTSYFGIDMSVSEKDLQKLYESINLSNKLIVLEDIERSKIDIVELLGYINSLVEQDSVKVLLVANENEIKNNSEENEYSRIKEKTISDTIQFSCDFDKAIENILKLFGNSYLDTILKKINDKNEKIIVTDIKNIMKTAKSFNLRALIYACQKTVDMLSCSNKIYDSDFVQFLLCGNIAFSLRLKKDDKIKWESEQDSPTNLGTYNFPLYKMCYDYIKIQSINASDIDREEGAFVKRKKAETRQKKIKAELDIVYSYYSKEEKEVITAVGKILQNLKEEKDISIYEYSKLGNYLISLKPHVDCKEEVECCLSQMIENVELVDEDLSNHIAYHDGIQLDTKEQAKEFSEFKGKLLEKTKENHSKEFNFDYEPSSINEFENYIYENKDSFVANGVFAKKFDMDKLVDMIKRCTAPQIIALRSCFNSVYSFSNIGDFFKEDKPYLIALRNGLSVLIQEMDIFDGIQRMQIQYFIDNIDAFINRMS
ncbi:MAG: hypothetical protein IJ400_06235 [Clostridia bacterium]|nr:hypothetical protein [Clostridia bacterium]